jgi:hypothetical protein
MSQSYLSCVSYPLRANGVPKVKTATPGNSYGICNKLEREYTFYVLDPSTKILKSDGTLHKTKPLSSKFNGTVNGQKLRYPTLSQEVPVSCWTQNRFLPLQSLAHPVSEGSQTVQTKNRINIALLNAQSLRQKTELLDDFRIEHTFYL